MPWLRGLVSWGEAQHLAQPPLYPLEIL